MDVTVVRFLDRFAEALHESLGWRGDQQAFALEILPPKYLVTRVVLARSDHLVVQELLDLGAVETEKFPVNRPR